MKYIIQGNSGTNNTNTDSFGNIQIKPPTGNSSQAAYSEVDPGFKINSRTTLPYKCDSDYRLLTSKETVLDYESASGTSTSILYSKLSYAGNGGTTNSMNPWTGYNTYNTNSIMGGSGGYLRSRAYFPIFENDFTNYETSMAFSSTNFTGQKIRFGAIIMQENSSNDPLSGVFFQFADSGITACAYNTELATPVPNTDHTSYFLEDFTNNIQQGVFYKFNIVLNRNKALFYINDELHCVINRARSDRSIMLVQAAPLVITHIGQLGILNTMIKSYCVSITGTSNKTISNGYKSTVSYGDFPGTTTYTSYTNNSLPTAAIPSNTVLTANLIAGLSGQCVETDTLAVNTDGIIASLQVATPNSTTSLIRKFKITGIKIDSFVQTTLTGGGYNAIYSLNVGSTAVPGTTVTGANSKAAKRILVGQETVAANAAAGTFLSSKFLDFSKSPIFLNGTEFIQVTKKKIGTAPSAGTIMHVIQLLHSTEN